MVDLPLFPVSDSVEDVIDKWIHYAHSLARYASVWMNLLEDLGLILLPSVLVFGGLATFFAPLDGVDDTDFGGILICYELLVKL